MCLCFISLNKSEVIRSEHQVVPLLFFHSSLSLNTSLLFFSCYRRLFRICISLLLPCILLLLLLLFLLSLRLFLSSSHNHMLLCICSHWFTFYKCSNNYANFPMFPFLAHTHTLTLNLNIHVNSPASQHKTVTLISHRRHCRHCRALAFSLFSFHHFSFISSLHYTCPILQPSTLDSHSGCLFLFRSLAQPTLPYYFLNIFASFVIIIEVKTIITRKIYKFSAIILIALLSEYSFIHDCGVCEIKHAYYIYIIEMPIKCAFNFVMCYAT